MDPDTDPQEREFHALYSGLKQVLARFGSEDAFGAADYWLVDDYYRAKIQRVSVSRISFLTRECVEAVQQLLAHRYPSWSATFALDLLRKDAPGHETGVIAFSDHIEERWDRDLLVRTYGKQFKWGAGRRTRF